MAGKGELELDGAGWALLLLAFGGIALLVYLAVKGIKIPENLYPYPLFSNAASDVDIAFAGLPGSVQAVSGPFQKRTDSFLGAIGAWIDDNLPRTPSERQSLVDDAANVDTSDVDDGSDNSTGDEEQ